MKLKKIREAAVDQWYKGLKRTRMPGTYSDNYSESTLCTWQRACQASKKHCSFICSFGDWLNNISDQLTDYRFDKLDKSIDTDALFRFYTKVLIFKSEIVEDFVNLDKQIMGFGGKKEAGQHLEKGVLPSGELKILSDFINSVAKHKTENDNLHVHNHHLTLEFEDFGDKIHDNQISLQHQDWGTMDKSTTILMPKLSYFIDVIIKLNNSFDSLMLRASGYKEKLFEMYSVEWED